MVGMLVVVLAGGGIFALNRRDQAAAAAPARTVAATTTTLQQTVSASGTIAPAHQATLSFASSGAVRTVSATVGATVSVGQSLATIDPTTLQGQLDLANAQLIQARAQVTAAANGTASQIAAANAQLASAEANTASAQTALSAATLRSPIDGVVASVGISVGDQVGSSSGGSGSSNGSSGSRATTGGDGSGGAGGTSASSGASSSATAATESISVISTDAWLVDTSVTNADLASLKKGMQAQITPTGATQAIFGTVDSVGIVATSSSSGVAQFPVTIAVTGKPTGLYAGTSAAVAIIVKQLPDVLVVPTLAVRTESGTTVVSVVKNGVTVTMPVTVGQVFGPQTQITKGLAAGDEVTVAFGGAQRGADGTVGTGGAGTGRTRTGTGGFGGGTGTGGFGGGTGS